MPTVAEVADQLRTAGTAWTTVLGTTRSWRHQDLVTAAFTAAHAEAAAGGSVMSTLTATRTRAPGGVDVPDDIIETTRELMVQRQPWRLRAELLTTRGGEGRPELLVVDGVTFWARTGTDTITNGGDPDVGCGGGEVTELLTPAGVLDLCDFTVTGEDRVAGRACTAVTATRGPGPHGSWPEPPFAMIHGGTRFRLSVDLAVGILLRVVKVVNDQDAEITEFTALTVDEALPDGLFAPLPDAHLWPPHRPPPGRRRRLGRFR